MWPEIIDFLFEERTTGRLGGTGFKYCSCFFRIAIIPGYCCHSLSNWSCRRQRWWFLMVLNFIFIASTSNNELNWTEMDEHENSKFTKMQRGQRCLHLCHHQLSAGQFLFTKYCKTSLSKSELNFNNDYAENISNQKKISAQGFTKKRFALSSRQIVHAFWI